MQLRLSPFILAFRAAQNELVEEQLSGAGGRAGRLWGQRRGLPGLGATAAPRSEEDLNELNELELKRGYDVFGGKLICKDDFV
ncbi:hypothetical protein D623_10022675 [Myotis brandtii]|uniref:Uncharacterized protein n=1 Tax=Myotis brandtii TaxID=109478 RepID=S7Q5S9_MYOBR|nr:hypothetical protein D623_10022675 [Myotis brandtii]